MIKKFFIKLFGDDSERLKLNRFLPPIKDLKIINQPIDELEFSPVQSKGIPVLIWINTRSIRCLNQFREKLNQDGRMDNLITVGQNISSNIALILGKIGVQNMYDLASDSDGFVNKLLDCYEQWKSNITEDKSI